MNGTYYSGELPEIGDIVVGYKLGVMEKIVVRFDENFAWMRRPSGAQEKCVLSMLKLVRRMPLPIGPLPVVRGEEGR